MVKEPKRPWLAALLAFFFGGPGFFYLGLRRGLVATLAWLLAALSVLLYFPSHPSGLVLLQAATAWLAFLICKRVNTVTAKQAESPEPDLAQRAQTKCAKEIRDVGWSVLAVSGFTLLVFASFTPPTIGEIGHFAHVFARVLRIMSIWGMATGIGLTLAWRWARVSMLIFGGLLTASGTILMVGYLFMPVEDMACWGVLAIRVLIVVISLIPVAIGVLWFRFFVRSNVKSYFGIPRKAPVNPA
jgi:hypothetical protein